MANIYEWIKDCETIGIAGHIRPDGDCLGSCTALLTYIKDNFPLKKVDVFLESVPPAFTYLPNSDLINTTYDKEMRYDVFITLDSGDLARIGNGMRYFEGAKKTVSIDHHISNPGYAIINHILPSASSTCEVLFDLFDYEKISLETATALYTGIIHDTGLLKHSNTSEKTMKIAGKLIAKEIMFSKIIDESFYQKTFLQNKVLGKCLMDSKLLLDGKCIASSISWETMNQMQATSFDLDGVIDQLRITKGVEAAVLIHESSPGEFKVSMRSNGIVNVSEIALFFNGGGHVMAAGCSLVGTSDEVIGKIVKRISMQLENLSTDSE